jgi:hypothetical protein
VEVRTANRFGGLLRATPPKLFTKRVLLFYYIYPRGVISMLLQFFIVGRKQLWLTMPDISCHFCQFASRFPLLFLIQHRIFLIQHRIFLIQHPGLLRSIDGGGAGGWKAFALRRSLNESPIRALCLSEILRISRAHRCDDPFPSRAANSLRMAGNIHLPPCALSSPLLF